MTSFSSQLFAILSAVLILVIVIEFLRRRLLRERHAIWWVLAGVLALIGGIFPGIVAWAASLLGIETPINLVFFVSVSILFLVCLQSSSELTRMENRIRVLAEQNALVSLRIQKLEALRDSDRDTCENE